MSSQKVVVFKFGLIAKHTATAVSVPCSRYIVQVRKVWYRQGVAVIAALSCAATVAMGNVLGSL